MNEKAASSSNGGAPSHMGRLSTRQTPAIVTLFGLALSGCGSFGGFPSFGNSASQQATAPEPEVAPEIPASIQSSQIVGRWGYASFHRPEDRARTEVAAKNQRAHPFVIGKGPTGGVMMSPRSKPKCKSSGSRATPAARITLARTAMPAAPRIARW